MTEQASSPLYNIFLTVKISSIKKDDMYNLLIPPLNDVEILVLKKR